MLLSRYRSLISLCDELAIAVGGGNVRFLVNGVEVAQKPRAEVPTDGIVGLRINHQLDVLVEKLSIVPSGGK